MLKFKKGDEVIVTGFISTLAEEYGTLGEVGVVEVVDDSEIPYFVKLESVKGGSGGLWFREDNLKSAKESTFHKGVVYSVGDVIERLDSCPYPMGSKHTIIRMHHSYEDCVVAVDEDGEEGVHSLVYVKKVIKDKEEDMDNFEKHNPELHVGDEVVILEHPVLKHSGGINYPDFMQGYIGNKYKIVDIHENGYRLSNHWNYEAKYLQKVVNDVDKSQILKQEIEVGDIVIVISLENTIREYGANESMKKVGESFIVKDVCKYEKDDLIEVFDEGGWSYDSRDLVILQKASDMKERKLAPIDLKLPIHCSWDLAATDDVVNHPKHYTDSEHGIECIELTRELSFNYGNCLKYVWRQGKKDEALQEVDKALWYYNDALENNVSLFVDGYPSGSFEDSARKVLQYSKGWFYVLINSILIEDIEGIGRALNGIKQETIEMKDVGDCCSK
ncbi:hypothetical protein TaPaz_96 [Acinetobacter phage TaPaz]|nr:hypothetical protein TaPaz_96 [Acinetobacter phage TaPaz]